MKKLPLFTLFLALCQFILLISCDPEDEFENNNITEGLVAFYPFNGNPNDESGNNKHGILDGPIPTKDRFSNSNSAYLFDGIDDAIYVKDNPFLFLNTEFTISAWVKTSEIKSQEIIVKGAGVNGSLAAPYQLAMSGTNDIIFGTRPNSILIQARREGYETNKWYMITGVLKNKIMYLYVNNILETTLSIDGELVDESSPLLIGTRLKLPSSTFKGIIDDIRIYDRALTGDEIDFLYGR